jgi:hypothetical protein
MRRLPREFERPLLDTFGMWRVVFVSVALLVFTLGAFFWTKSYNSQRTQHHRQRGRSAALTMARRVSSATAQWGVSRLSIAGDWFRQGKELDALGTGLREEPPESRWSELLGARVFRIDYRA